MAEHRWQSLRSRQMLTLARLEPVSLYSLIHATGFEFFQKVEVDQWRRATLLEALTVRLHTLRLMQERLECGERALLEEFCAAAQQSRLPIPFRVCEGGIELTEYEGRQFIL